nr:hypothetical protein [Mycoplasmopsis bovis]
MKKGSLENQKKYVIDEVNNIYSLINGLAGMDISKYLSAEDIVNFSKDPKEVINAFQNIITKYRMLISLVNMLMIDIKMSEGSKLIIIRTNTLTD